MMVDISEFLTDYDDETNDVIGSSRVTYDANLKEWIAHIRDNPFTNKVVSDLLRIINVIEWIDKTAEASSFGQEPIKWPNSKPARLAVQYAIFETLSDDREDFVTLYQNFFGAASDISGMVRDFNDQLFVPMARDLRKWFVKLAEREGDDKVTEGSDVIPASDRIVSIDDNQLDRAAATSSIATLEKVVREANDYEDQGDREMRLAELSAGSRLLEASRVSLRAIANTLGRALKWLMDKFAGGLIATAAKTAWDHLIPLLGDLTRFF